MATVWNQCDANFCPKFKQERLHDNVYLVLPTQHNKRNIYVSITEVFDGENGWTNVRFLCVKGWRVRPTKFCRWIILHHQYVLLMGLPCNIFILIKQFSRSLSTNEDYNSLTVSETDDAFRNFCMATEVRISSGHVLICISVWLVHLELSCWHQVEGCWI